jgi:predicted dehydrogenase
MTPLVLDQDPPSEEPPATLHPTTLALVGLGAWGSNWLCPLAALPEANLTWCCDVSATALARAPELYPTAKLTADLDVVLSDPAVEGVVLATSASTHFDLARRVLLAGKHVLVEKPLTLRASEASELNRLAEEQRRVLMVGHLLDHHPALTCIKELIDSGDLGEIHYLYCQRLNFGRVHRDENAWWSLAPHDLSMALRLLGDRPEWVQCHGQNIVQPDVPDVVFATLGFPGDRLAHVHVSWLDPHEMRKLTVVGSRKMVTFDDTAEQNKVTVYDRSCRCKPAERGANWIALHAGEVSTPRIEPSEPLMLEARHFIDCIRMRRRPFSDGDAGARVVALLEHGQRSLETGQAVHLPAAQIEEAVCCHAA